MAKPTKLTGSLFAVAVIAGCLVVAVLVNMISGKLFGRVDLTENNLNTLSDASKAAVEALDQVEVTVYISPDLPETVRDQAGGERVMRDVVQKFGDKLEEYRSYSEGKMTLRYERGEDAVEKGRNAKLQVFAGDEATAAAGRLQFKEYVLGATFHYKNVMETLPLALYPEHYEFELTKIFMRLKDKFENSITMRDVLRVGEEVSTAATACDTAIAASEPKDDAAPTNPFGLLSKEATGERIAGYKAALESIKAECAGLGTALGSAATFKGRHESLDRVMLVADAFNGGIATFEQVLTAEDEQQAGQALSVADQLHAVAQQVTKEYDDLVDSPGRRSIGFVCVGSTFCPFPEQTPLIQPELRGVIGQKNPFAQQLVGQMDKMEERIAGILSSVEGNLFKRRGFDIVRVDLGERVTTSVSSLVVFGAKAALTDHQLYQLDQFVMRGGSLVVFLNDWDVSLQNLSPQGEMNVTGMKRNASNIGDLLATWGVKPTGKLVAEPESNDVVTVLALIRQGQLTWQTQRKFPYPLLPVLNEFDATSPLVRAVSSLTLPHATSLELVTGAGHEVTALVTSSDKSISVSDPTFPLEPGAQVAHIASTPGDGPHVVAATVTGTLTSHFAGKDAPTTPTPPSAPGEAPPADADNPADTRLDSGEGRVLVIGSNLGLEPLSREAIFEGFDMAELTGGNFEIVDKGRQWVANLQNWEVRLGQVQHTLGDNLQFLFNVLDWSIQQEALVEIRSKQYTRRPLEQIDEDEQATIKVVAIALAPLLFILFGVLKWYMRSRRMRTLSV